MFHLVYLPEIKATSEDLDVCGDVFIKTCIIFSVMYYQKKFIKMNEMHKTFCSQES